MYITQGVPCEEKTTENYQTKIKKVATINEINDSINSLRRRGKNYREKWIDKLRKEWDEIFRNYTKLDPTTPLEEMNVPLKSFMATYKDIYTRFEDGFKIYNTVCEKIADRYGREAEIAQNNVDQANVSGQYEKMVKYLRELDKLEEKIKSFIEDCSQEVENMLEEGVKRGVEHFEKDLRSVMETISIL